MTRTHRTLRAEELNKAMRKREHETGAEHGQQHEPNGHDRELTWEPEASPALSSLGSEPLGPSNEPPLVVTYDDFYAFSPTAQYIFRPTGGLWLATAIDRRLRWKEGPTPKSVIAPSAWLLKNRPVEGMTWMPGEPELIRHRLLLEGGWIEHIGATVYNLYRPPTIEHGDPVEAARWLELVEKLFAGDADLVIDWCAHRVQYPGIKINHSLLLGGDFGIGKDSLLEPVVHAVGPWNSETISPAQFIGRFNGHLKKVVLRIAEARDGERFDRFAFYDAMKSYGAAPPATIRIDEKHKPEYSVPNVVGIVITFNRKNALHLEPGDRRHAVAWSRCHRSDFADDYFDKLYAWYRAEGFGHVAAYLAQHDLAHFNPKAPPRKTEAFYDIVNSARPSEDAEMADVLDRLAANNDPGNDPPARRTVVTVAMVRSLASESFAGWLGERANRRLVAHRFEACGYTPVRNPDRDTGLWVINGQRQVVYGLASLDRRTLIDEVRKLQTRGGQ